MPMVVEYYLCVVKKCEKVDFSLHVCVCIYSSRSVVINYCGLNHCHDKMETILYNFYPYFFTIYILRLILVCVYVYG